MGTLKRIALLCAVLFGFLYAYGVFANQEDSDWHIENNLNTQFVLFFKNSSDDKIGLTCVGEHYLIATIMQDKMKYSDECFFDYRIDNHSITFNGKNFVNMWVVPGVWYNLDKDGIQGDIDKYKVLFQQMLHAKKSLIVNAIDAEGKIQGTASFSVKGLPEALIEFAKQCGSDFQTYSGIDIKRMEK
ncbi:hypothetical protein RHO14_12050 [Orbus wheelerorum]|uniref:hypothetical protein n=1 Tax=Orbus wheelerorum TaxID=3074111 RepID=UPI00370D9025